MTSGQNKVDNTKIIDRIGVIPIRIIAKKEHDELLSQIDKALEQIEKNDFTFSHRLYAKYYAQRDYANAVLTEEEEAAIKDIEKLRVGYGVDYEPVQYQSDEGEPSGICIDLLNLIFGKLDVALEYIPLKRGETYTSDDVDVVITFTEEEKVEGFTKTSQQYTKRSLMMLGSPLSKAMMEKNIIGVMDYTNVDVTKLKTGLPSYSIRFYNNTAELNEALATGEITHMVATTISIDRAATRFGTKDYSIYNISQDLPFYINYSEKISQEVISGVNKIISSIDESTKDIIYLENVQKLEQEYSFLQILKDHLLEIIVTMSGIVTLIVLAIFLKMRHNARKMKKLLEYDQQTGVSTLYKFKEDAKTILKNAKPNQYMLISIDIDNFKHVNESFGFEFGTELLKIFIKAINCSIKENELIARSFADEILLLIEAMEEVPLAPANLRAYLTKSEFEKLEYITASVGCYYVEDTKKNIDSMVDCATIARKSKKQHYGNTIGIYNEAMEKQRETANFVTSTAKAAIENKEFQLYFQPQIKLDSRKMVGAEVLVRWISDEKVISPRDFIPIFEKNGFIVELDLYILAESFKKIEKYKSLHKEKSLMISVNISRYTLLDKGALGEILCLAQKYKNSFLKMIEIEITESAFTADKEKLIAAVSQLKKVGYKIAMDDFGTEYSSPSSLLEIAVDIVKIDKCMIDSINQKNGKAFVTSIIQMLQNLNYTIIIEGVETKEQVVFLQQFEHIIIQGYYFAKPMPFDEFI